MVKPMADGKSLKEEVVEVFGIGVSAVGISIFILAAAKGLEIVVNAL